jgi:hypothetical protein
MTLYRTLSVPAQIGWNLQRLECRVRESLRKVRSSELLPTLSISCVNVLCVYRVRVVTFFNYRHQV